MIPARAASQRGPSGRNLLFSLFGPKNFSVRKRMNGPSRFISRPLTMVRTLEMFRDFFQKIKLARLGNEVRSRVSALIESPVGAINGTRCNTNRPAERKRGVPAGGKRANS